MNAPFIDLFLAIQARITDVVPEIAYTDQDLGQLNSKTRPPVSWPCLLIDFDNFRFRNLGENVQTAKGTVVLRLGFAPHANTSQITPKIPRLRALDYYNIEWAVHKALHGWNPDIDAAGSLTRSSATTQVRTDGYRVRELHYKIAFDDYSTKSTQLYAPATLVVTDKIQL